MRTNEYSIMAEKLKVIAHPHRLSVVRTLIENEESNVKSIQDWIGISQSSASQHLAKLRAAGIVEGTRTGSEVSYKVIDDKIKKIIKCLF